MFEAGQKNGVYRALSAVDDTLSTLDDEAIDTLYYTKDGLIESIKQRCDAASSATFLRNRLEELKRRDEKAKAELNEINRRREEIHKIMEKCEDESEVLSELLKEIKK